ncbi:Cell division protein FtsY homolog [Aedoeadaptatus ivorii]|uniref:Signal recognition particle receptor FtsY n=1 Tax=Aedoeadaptatus ivorii TaxID=54006 RepID=A0A448V1M7_9FIRM|nr:signal recognition particle-docking protein FtsY [Peptoniphilus ivorii]MDQ0507885.1 fused signal recognition particle receptor [Peptoniphilus ivorii]VEJ35711.1 Cell division protein FtsY homolog [Peptoniphilus ivorii]
MLEWLKRKIGKKEEEADSKERGKEEELRTPRPEEEGEADAAASSTPPAEAEEREGAEKMPQPTEEGADFYGSDTIETSEMEEIEKPQAEVVEGDFQGENADSTGPMPIDTDTVEMEVSEGESDQSPEEAEEVPRESEPEKKGFFAKLVAGLTKTRDDMNYKINDILGNYVKIDDDMMEDLEDILISSDIGMETTMLLIDRLKERIRKEQIQDPKEVRPLLSDEIARILEKNKEKSALDIEPSPAVILVVGVNGVGKTTTIGKIAYRLKKEGKSVMIAAADTFRAAAIEQIETWGARSDTPVISHKEGADPAAVVYDAIQAQKSRNIDVLICDTAGRLHNKKNLMNELEKIHRVIEREHADARRESLLVLDATTGQNAILQAKTFDAVTDLTGLVLTKLDGTAKGGVVLPLIHELDIPIKLIGVGEGMEDLQDFSGEDFAEALMQR